MSHPDRQTAPMLDDDACYRAVLARDARFDGWFFSGVRTTGIFCRPSCPARTPHRRNIEFHPTAAAAVRAGFRACLRCRPDTTPGSPEWNLAGDVAARAVRAINDGVVDREGIPGLADRLGYSVRQLHRLLTTSLGAGPIELARAHRAATARTLLETTELPVTQVAFASGFRSTRQFNDTIRDVFACTPTALRHGRGADDATLDGLGAHAAPRAATALRGGTAVRRSSPHERSTAWRWATRRRYARTLSLPHAARHARRRRARHRTRRGSRAGCGSTTSATCPPPSSGRAGCSTSTRTRSPSTPCCAVTRVLRRGVRAAPRDPRPGPRRRRRGRDPRGARPAGERRGRDAARGGADGALRRVRHTRRTVVPHVPGRRDARQGRPRGAADAAGARAARSSRLPRRWPTAPCASTPRRTATRSPSSLAAIKGIGPWTVSYVRMRALGDPDAFLPGDLALRRALERLDGPPSERGATAAAQAWRPYRSYAMVHLGPTTRRPRRVARATSADGARIEIDDHERHKDRPMRHEHGNDRTHRARDDLLGGGRLAARGVPASPATGAPSSPSRCPDLGEGGRARGVELRTRARWRPATAQLDEYFDGTRRDFDLDVRAERDAVPARRVAGARRTIPYGETASYRDVATAIGNPRATRAVGLANNRNPIALLIPCHRVIGADGSLTGYGGGLEMKSWLLAHERDGARGAAAGRRAASRDSSAASAVGAARRASAAPAVAGTATAPPDRDASERAHGPERPRRCSTVVGEPARAERPPRATRRGVGHEPERR